MPRKPNANTNLYVDKTCAGLAYHNHAGKIKEGLKRSSFVLDEQMSDHACKVLYSSSTKQVVVSYQGTYVRDPDRIWKDLTSDVNILLGQEWTDKQFKGANALFKQAVNKCRGQGYTLDTKV